MDGAIMEEEKSTNGREVGKEYGVSGEQQLREKQAEREAERAALEQAGFYYPPGATEPVPIRK